MLEFFADVSVADAHFASPAAQADWVLGAPFSSSTRYKVEIKGKVSTCTYTATGLQATTADGQDSLVVLDVPRNGLDP